MVSAPTATSISSTRRPPRSWSPQASRPRYTTRCPRELSRPSSGGRSAPTSHRRIASASIGADPDPCRSRCSQRRRNGWRSSGAGADMGTPGVLTARRAARRCLRTRARGRCLDPPSRSTCTAGLDGAPTRAAATAPERRLRDGLPAGRYDRFCREADMAQLGQASQQRPSMRCQGGAMTCCRTAWAPALSPALTHAVGTGSADRHRCELAPPQRDASPSRRH